MKLNDRNGPDTEQAWAKTGKKLALQVVDGGIAMQSDMSPREALIALLSAANVAAAALATQGMQAGISPEATRVLMQVLIREHFPMLEGKS